MMKSPICTCPAPSFRSELPSCMIYVLLEKFYRVNSNDTKNTFVALAVLRLVLFELKFVDGLKDSDNCCRVHLVLPKPLKRYLNNVRNTSRLVLD